MVLCNEYLCLFIITHMLTKNDIMRRARDLAQKNAQNGGWPFAGIIVKNNTIIAEAVNGVHVSHDPSDHAEIAAIRKASSLIKSPDLSSCELYVVGVPCPMCLTCVILSKIKKVYYAVDTQNKDEALTKLPATNTLYDLVKTNHGSSVIDYEHIKAFSEEGKGVFKTWNTFAKE